MLKKSYIFGALLVPLPFGTVWFWVWTTKAYKVTAQYVPLELLRPEGPDSQLVSTSSAPAVLPSAIGAADQVPGHVLIDVGQPTEVTSATTNGAAATNGQANGIAVATATAVITPGGSQRLIPKSAVEDDDYQAIPDRYTDYRQPPMTLYPGVLNSNMRLYISPAISGPLPTLWLPLRKTSDGKKPNRDEESQIGDGHGSDSDSDDGHHIHDHVESALQRPPFKLPTKSSDEPQSYDEGDNLVGGGQDEPISAQTGSSSATITSKSLPAPAPSRGPQAVSNVVSEPAPSVPTAGAGTTSSSSNTSTTTAPADSTEDSSASAATPAKPNPAVDGLNEVYYHHPERAPSEATVDATPETESSEATAPRVRTVQGQGSRADLLQQQQQ